MLQQVTHVVSMANTAQKHSICADHQLVLQHDQCSNDLCNAAMAKCCCPHDADFIMLHR